MESIVPPGCIDVQNFQFKLQRKIRAFKSKNALPSSQLYLVAAASRLGILFLGSSSNQLHVFQLRDVLQEGSLECPRRVIQFDGQIISIALNCTQDLLSVAYCKNNTLIAAIYHTKSCISDNPAFVKEIVLSPTNNVQLLRILWNPCQAETLAAVTSDGVLSVYECKQNSVGVTSKPVAANCFSWSPKGKQLVTGNQDGSLCQWKPDLTLVKKIPAPPNVIEAIAIHWLSNTQFCVVYEDNENKPCVTIVNTPKTGNPVCINYEDICYSMVNSRPKQYYLTHLPSWGVILVSSSNSMEVGVLGTTDQNNWQQWIQMDEARAELPLTEDKQDCYPVGVAFDDSAIYQLPWGENETLPHMPALHILSHTGLLVSYYCINLSSLQTTMCSPASEIFIPNHLCTLDYEACNVTTQPSPSNLPSGGSNSDISFALPSITSTPTIAKPTNANQQPAVKPIATNLFGAPSYIQPTSNTLGNMTQPKPNSQKAEIDFKSTVISHPQTSNYGGDDPNKSLSTQSNTALKLEKSVQQPKEVVAVRSDTAVAAPKMNTVSNETIKSLYLKEINEFETHFYKEMKKQQGVNVKVGSGEEMKYIMEILEIDAVEPLDKLYSYSDVKQQITLSKQYLVKMCTVLIEAKLQPESLELTQLAQLDSVSQEKMVSIKQMMYYVESQLKQITNVLDDQWNTFQDHCMKSINARQQMNSGDIMKMPTLDKVYQPLVKHQDILMKQQATVKTLQKLLDNMKPHIYAKKSLDATKSTHSLSNLTKNLLNLNINTTDLYETKYKSIFENESKYTVKKYNALREMLGDCQMVRIKPVKVELPNKWESLINQEKLHLVKQDVKKEVQQEKEPVLAHVLNVEPQNQVTKNSNINVQSNVNFFDDTIKNNDIQKQSNSKPNDFTKLNTVNQNSCVKTNMSSPFTGATPVQSLDSKPTQNPVQPVTSINTSDISSLVSDNMFMGQTICSPTPKQESQSSKPISNNASVKTIESLLKKEVLNTQPKTVPATTVTEKLPQLTVTPAITSVAEQQKSTTVSSSSIGSFNFDSLSVSKTIENNTPTTKANVDTSRSLFGNTVANGILFGPKSVFASTASSFLTPGTPATTSLFSTSPLVSESQKTRDKVKIEKPIPVSQTVANSSPSIFGTAVKSAITVKPTVTSGNATVAVSLPTTSAPEIKPLTPSATTAASIKVDSSSAISTTTSQISPPSSPSAISIFSAAVSNASTTLASTSLFGTPTTTTSGFGSPVTTASVFGGSVTTASAFGGNGSSSSIFGNASTNNSVFSPSQASPGFGVTPVASSLFANANASLTSTEGMFESLNVTTTSASPSAVFGSPTPATCASAIFGNTNTAASSTITSLFGTASISTSGFGTSPNSSGSIFGSSTFGQPTGNSLFGGSSSAFGQAASQGNLFGGGSTFGSNSFGSPSNVFGQTGNTQGTNLFGSPTPATPGSIFGGASQSLFGSPSTFGSTSTQSSVFGGASTFGSKPLFGQSSFGSPTSGGFGSFSNPSDQQSVSQAGFGSPSTFGKPAAFGGAPAFGSPTSFGSNPTFGGSATFGGSPTKLFGSPGGENVPAFGSSQSSTFENLANQNTLTFGNLAQQSQPNPAQNSSFQSSKSFTSWR